MMRRAIVTTGPCRLPVGGLLSAFLLLAAIGSPASAATLIITRTGTDRAQGPVLANLFFDGKLIRSLELPKRVRRGSGKDWWVTEPVAVSEKLTGLPPGQYEVHFQAAGYGKIVKNLYVSDENENEVYTEIGEKGPPTPLHVGGPSLQQVWQLLQKLQEDNSDLQARIKRLEADVNQLKGTASKRY
jgi:hypothetical protein